MSPDYIKRLERSTHSNRRQANGSGEVQIFIAGPLRIPQDLPMRRFWWLLIPLAFLLTAVVAWLLIPDPSGMGTHRALGLPECWFHTLTGKPCPSCGLTTSFVHLMHGNIRLSFKSHPLGPVIFALFAWASALSLLEFRGRKTVLDSLLRGHHFKWVGGGSALFMAVWAGRLLWEFRGL